MKYLKFVALGLAFVSVSIGAQQFTAKTAQVQNIPGGGILTTIRNFEAPFGSYTIESEQATMFAPSSRSQAGMVELQRAFLADETGELSPIYVGNARLNLDDNGNAVDLRTDYAIVGKTGAADTRKDAAPVPNALGDSVTYSCSNGILYANGSSTGQSSVCVGSAEFSCVGNQLVIRLRQYKCVAG
ncbi:MAG TPA: hypothetical protein VLK26_11380 [Rudaea sp.]|nr:hypothetical protein [Rudaea sp.]